MKCDVGALVERIYFEEIRADVVVFLGPHLDHLLGVLLDSAFLGHLLELGLVLLLLHIAGLLENIKLAREGVFQVLEAVLLLAETIVRRNEIIGLRGLLLSHLNY